MGSEKGDGECWGQEGLGASNLALECFSNIAWYGEADGLVDVVPLEGGAAIKCTCPVSCCFVFGGDDTCQIFIVFLANILDANVINYKGKNMGRVSWRKSSECLFTLVVASMFGKVGN